MMDPNANHKPSEPASGDGYHYPIARIGEAQYACVMRNRSGMDAGSIDMGARSIDHLCKADQQAAVNSAFAVYEKWCEETGLRAARDTRAA